MGGSNCIVNWEVVPQGPFDHPGLATSMGGDPLGGDAGPPESQDGGTDGGQPEAISQPVDPGGVGGYIGIFVLCPTWSRALSFLVVFLFKPVALGATNRYYDHY